MSKLLYYDLPRLDYFQREWLKPNGYSFVCIEMDESDKFWWEVYRIKEEENGSKRLDVGQLDSR
jgi:hypothetical protein